jgi:hypothetical protein
VHRRGAVTASLSAAVLRASSVARACFENEAQGPSLVQRSETRNETMKWRPGLRHDFAEARLGFNFGKRGLSRDSRARETPETLRLIERISILIERYVAYPPTKLFASKSFRREAGDIFIELAQHYGPNLTESLDHGLLGFCDQINPLVTTR